MYKTYFKIVFKLILVTSIKIGKIIASFFALEILNAYKQNYFFITLLINNLAKVFFYFWLKIFFFLAIIVISLPRVLNLKFLFT